MSPSGSAGNARWPTSRPPFSSRSSSASSRTASRGSPDWPRSPRRRRACPCLLLFVATVGTVVGVVTAAGEEIGWRGYLLTRLIDAGVPRPVLVSGVIWGLWHVPLIVAGVYIADSGQSRLLTVLLFMVTVISFGVIIARFRLATGSVWPAIVLHAAWNSIIQQGFDRSTTGANAALWTGEAGILVATMMIIAAVVISLRPGPMLRSPGDPMVVGAGP